MRLIRQRWHAARSDDGFTLMELLVAVSIVGFISSALCGVVLAYLKTVGTTEARLKESTDQQFISTYWQTDVSSLGRRTFNASNSTFTTPQSVFVGVAGPSGCGASVGTVIVAFAWNDFSVGATVPANAWTGTTSEAAYVSVANGSQTVLKRVRCTDGTAEPTVTVAHNISGAISVKCDDDDSDDTNEVADCDTAVPNRVLMTFTVRDQSEPGSTGYTTTVTADRRQG